MTDGDVRDLLYRWRTWAKDIEDADPGDQRNQVEAETLRLCARELEDTFTPTPS